MIIVGMRYSNDTRKIAIKLLLEDNKNIEEVSGLLGIYHETLEKWLVLYESGKLFKIKNSTGRPRVYDYEGLKKFVKNNPDLHLREIKEQFFHGEASLSGIDSALDKLEITFKKKLYSTKKEMKVREKYIHKKFKN